MTDRCAIARCRAEADLAYLGHGLCSRHWSEFTNENAPPDALRMALGIEAAPEPMMENTVMSKPKSEKNTAVKTEKAAKKRAPKVDKEDLRTLALRVTNAEFELVHKAAGPRNLSGFMKNAVMGAANR